MSQSQPLDLRALKESVKEPSDKPGDAMLISRNHEFSLTYNAPDGKEYTAKLVSSIMDGDERIDVARIAAKRAGVAWELLPKAQAARIWAQATIAIQLRDIPDWLGKWSTEDDALLFSCFDVCSLHEAEFFRNSAGEGTENQAKARVSGASTLAASTD